MLSLRRVFFWWWPPCLLRQVVVNLKSDDTAVLRGVLWSSRGGWFTLRSVSAERGPDVRKVDGDVVLHRSNVAFFQVMP